MTLVKLCFTIISVKGICPTHTGKPKGGKVEKMYDKLEEKINALYERLDNLEGCEDNPVYRDEIETIRAELSELIAHIETEFF